MVFLTKQRDSFSEIGTIVRAYHGYSPYLFLHFFQCFTDDSRIRPIMEFHRQHFHILKAQRLSLKFAKPHSQDYKAFLRTNLNGIVND